MHTVQKYKNIHEGKQAVIVCNGPSLNKMKLSFLKNEIVFGLNKIFLGFERYDFRPDYYVAVNELVLQQSVDEIQKLSCPKFLSNRAPDLYTENEHTHILNTLQPQARFCTNIEVGLNEGWTVTYATMQIAFYMGIKKLIIIGMDHRYQYHGEANEERSIKGADNNHFCDNYFGYGQKWHNPDLQKSEESYKVAREVFEKDGRQIIDATLDGACTIFPKADYQSVFSYP